MINYDSKDEIKSRILKRFNEWREGSGELKKHKDSDLNKFSRRQLTQRLGAVLDSIVS